MPIVRLSRHVLQPARARHMERMILLGDYVGYGADPAWAVDAVAKLVDEGAKAIRGNHDNAVRDVNQRMSDDAQTAIVWTRGRLTAGQSDFLESLPLTYNEDGILYVHAEASDPADWHYVRSVEDAARSLARRTRAVTFLRSCSSTGALFDIGGRQDDGFCADNGYSGAVVVTRPQMACGPWIGRSAARWNCRGVLCDVRYDAAGNHVLPRSI